MVSKWKVTNGEIYKIVDSEILESSKIISKYFKIIPSILFHCDIDLLQTNMIAKFILVALGKYFSLGGFSSVSNLGKMHCPKWQMILKKMLNVCNLIECSCSLPLSDVQLDQH